MLAASMVMSASTGMVSAKGSAGAGASVTGDVSDASTAAESTSRSSQKTGSAAENIAVEGSALTVSQAPAGLNGSGTSAAPYQIGSLSDLVLMNRYINYEQSGVKYFELTNDIDLSKVRFTDFDGVKALVSAKPTLSGNANVYFRLNGNGHKLYGLNASTSKSATNVAIFGVVNANSSIENLVLEGCTLRINSAADGAFALLAVQNYGTIRNVTIKDSVLDLRLGNISSVDKNDGPLSGIGDGHVYRGCALGVADNAGVIEKLTITGSDTNKGIFTKGARSCVGLVAGQNRKQISDVAVSGVRIAAFGSEDGDSSLSGKGVTAACVGGVVGKNLGKSGSFAAAVIRDAKVRLTYGSDIVFGNSVGGIAGSNAGTITGSAVTGTSSANLYGCGRFGGIAGVNSGTIEKSGAYDVGLSVHGKASDNAFGGVAGVNSGTISDSVASGSIRNDQDTSAAVGGLVGQVESASTIARNYTVVRIGAPGANVGAVVGKNGTSAYVGQNNYWSSLTSGISTCSPVAGGTQGDLVLSKAVVNVPLGSGGVTLDASALALSWEGSKAVATADFSGKFTISNSAISLKQSASSVTLSSKDDGAYGDLDYTVSISVPAGISGKKISADASVPVYVTASNGKNPGATADNPIVLTTYAQLKIMKYAPTAHYKLGADITLGSDWTPVAFSGTLNGDGHTLYVSTPLFASVTGSRNDQVSAQDWKSSARNLSSGYIYALNIVPVSRVDGGVFGAVEDATLRDITYTVTEDNKDGFVVLAAPSSGALIDTLTGNDYLLRCRVSVPIVVTASSSDGVGALAGNVSARHLIAEQCETSSLISLEKNLNHVGGLFGDLTVRGSGVLSRCSASGCIYVSKNVSDVLAKVFVGTASSNIKAVACTYKIAAESVPDGTVAKSAAPFTDGLVKIEPVKAESGEEDVPEVPALVLPEVIKDDLNMDEAGLQDLTYDTANGCYVISSKADLEAMRDAITADTAGTVARDKTYELRADINMGGDTFGMATTYQTAFMGTFRGATKSGGGKYTISNFTIPGKSYAANTSATALFAYAKDATFNNFAIQNANVTNAGTGTAILVGFADHSGTNNTGTATDCTFTNIDIIGCTVTSTRSASGTGYNKNTGVAQAGALIGAVWSTQTGDVYTIQNITVKDTSVINTNAAGGWAVGGLIGDCNVSTGTLCIGAAGTTPSIVLEHVTVRGFGMVGGVLGKAGYTAPNNTTAVVSGATGGILINNVAVTGNENGDSSIYAGTGSGYGGSCGGILGAEMTATYAAGTTPAGTPVNGLYDASLDMGGMSRAAILNCTVSDTSIYSNLAATSITSYYTDCGGIAGHMSGTFYNCKVTDCSITSCTPGGIVGRPSRKSNSHAGTLVTIKNCQVLGETTLQPTGTSSVYEAGGIICDAITTSVDIQNCGVGSDVTISGRFKYAGGFVSRCTGNTATLNYKLRIKDSIMLGTVEATANISDSAVGGAVACSMYTSNETANTNPVQITHCVIGGVLNNNYNDAGGVIGYYGENTACQNLIKDCTIIASIDQGTGIDSSKLNSAFNKTAKLVARVPVAVPDVSWMRNLTTSCPDNIVSSYPQDCPYLGWYGDSTTGNFDDRTDIVYTGSVTDVNKPDGTNYVHGSTNPVHMDGNDLEHYPNPATVSVTHNSYNGGSSARLTFDDTTNTTQKKVYGWVSLSNGDLVVNSVASSSTTSVNMTAKRSTPAGTTFGVTGKYMINSFVIPGTVSDVPTISVLIPVTSENIVSSAIDLEGDGSSGNPFQISSLEKLNLLRDIDYSNPDYSGKIYAVTTDLAFSASDFASDGDFYNGGAFFAPITGASGTVFNGTLTGTYGGVNHSISGLRINSTAEKAGLFAETDGATIINLTFTDTQITSTGKYAGGLVGYAEDTTFNSVTVTGTQQVPFSVTGSGSVYAGSLAAYAIDATVTGSAVSGVSVSGAYFCGGLFGHAHYSSTASGNSIQNTTIASPTVTSSYLDPNPSTPYSDTAIQDKADAVGGIAAEFAGTISGVTLSGAGSITGGAAGGAIGLVDNTVGASCSLTGVSITGAYTVTSDRQLQYNAAAGGLVGKVHRDDQVAGAAMALTITGCSVGSNVTVSAAMYAGGIVGNSGTSVATTTITATSPALTFSRATVSATYTGNAVGAIAGCVGNLTGFWAKRCSAGGTLNGENIGGVIGKAAGTAVNAATDIVTHTVVCATMSSSATKRGVLIGTVSTTVLPNSLGTSPFTNIYYSTYQIASSVGLSGDDAYTNYKLTYRDLQSEITFGAGESKTIQLTAAQVQAGYIDLQTSSFNMPSGYMTSGGTYLDFTCETNVRFELDSLYGENGTSVFSYNDSTHRITLENGGMDVAVLEYKNGLKISFKFVGSDIQGSGDYGDEFLITKIDHLAIMTQTTGKYFILAADLDFDSAAGTAWAANWGTWADEIESHPFASFVGTYQNTKHKIMNLTVSSSTAAAVGFFPKLPSGAVVCDVAFEGCKFTATGSDSNAGILVGENRGTVSGVSISGGSVEGVKHVGAIAGVSFAQISGCTVSAGTKVTATHCAGGIVGGGSNVTGCAVSGATVKANEYVGGIAGGNMSVTTELVVRDGNNSVINADTIALRAPMLTSSYTNCTVSGSTIATNAVNVAGFAGGILGIAESGASGTNNPAGNTEIWRSVTITSCYIDANANGSAPADGTRSQIMAQALENTGGTIQSNYAGGIVGYIAEYHDNVEIRSCSTFATVSAFGDYGLLSTTSRSSAGGILGATNDHAYYKLYQSGAPTFRILNNVCSGKVRSTNYAGGVAGRLRMTLNNTTNTYAIAGGDFISGNLISCSFENLEQARTNQNPRKGGYGHFGIFVGYLYTSSSAPTGIFATSLTSEQIADTMKDNYYSSYRTNHTSETTELTAFGPTDISVSVCKLYDVAKAVIPSGQTVAPSSFKVNNGSGFEEIVVGEATVTNNVYFVVNQLYERPAQFMFNKGGSNTSDFATNNYSMVAYSGVADGEQHTLQLGADSFYGNETAQNYFTIAVKSSDGTLASPRTAQLTATSSPSFVNGQELIASLGYGLEVGLKISTGDAGDGSDSDPYIIPNEDQFIHYFFSDFTTTATNQYNLKCYLQTADLDFDVIETKLSNAGKTFKPIGSAEEPFYGRYDASGYMPTGATKYASGGAAHKITNFHYSAPAPTAADYQTDVGLFGYVTDGTVNVDHLKDLHIELSDGMYSLDGTDVSGDTLSAAEQLKKDEMTNNSYDLASVCGGTNTGGLVGRYVSTRPIKNCSVVNGTVRSNRLISTNQSSAWTNVGGLVGLMRSAELKNCFTSVNVRALDIFDNSTYTTFAGYNAGGLVGCQEDVDTDAANGSRMTFNRCFSSSDVVAPYWASGFLGRPQRYVTVTDSCSTATVTALYPVYGTYNYGPSQLVGYKGDAQMNPTSFVTANNVYIAGVNTSEYARSIPTDDEFYYTTLFGLASLENGSANVYYDASVLGRISASSNSTSPNILKTNGALIGMDGGSPDGTPDSVLSVSTKSTEELTDADFVTDCFGGSAAFTATAGSYPVLNMALETGQTADPYFETYASLAAIPVWIDSREADDVSASRLYAGITYPVRIASTDLTSSTYSAATDTLTYPSDCDTSLTGNGGNKKTDFLFKSVTGGTLILRNSYLDFGSSRGSIPRNQKSPYVRVGGSGAHRDIRIGLRGSSNTVYVATERQLRAIQTTETVGTKFGDAYSGAKSKNIRICADIELNASEDFPPITGFTGATTGDTMEGAFKFDGSNCIVSNMTINSTASPAGMFGSFESGTPKVQNLILKNVNVTGGQYTGALVGQITNAAAAQIRNCMVIDGTVQGTARTGGLIGTITGASGSRGIIDRVGVVGVEVKGSGSSETGFGILAGEMTMTDVTNSYTVGSVNANTLYVGGLAGTVNNCTANGVVTSGYVRSNNASAVVGGIFGRTQNGTTLTNAESTAFVNGTATLGGLIGEANGGSLQKAIFAGSVNTTGATRSRIIGSNSSASVTTATVFYDKQLQLENEAIYTTASMAKTTTQLAQGGAWASALVNNDADDLDEFTFDTNAKYYPRPVTLSHVLAEEGKIGHVISEEFETGLMFALARINLSYGGIIGTVSAYNQITVTTPIGDNSANTVSLTEDGDLFSNAQDYLANNGVSVLVPNTWEANKYTGVQADLARTANSEATFAGCTKPIYRFLVVKVVRTVEIDYEIIYDATASDYSANSDSVGLMVSTQDNSITYSSNAVTSRLQDANTATGSYTVKFMKVIVSGTKLYVDSLLYDGYKATYTVGADTGYSGTIGSDSGGTYIDITNAPAGSNNIRVKLNVTISEDPSWGLRDLTGGLTNT